MRHILSYLLVLGAVLGSLSLQSCENDDNYDYSVNYPNALVTIKTNSSTGQVYLQLDDETTVLPTNMKTSPDGNKELRALTNLNIQDVQGGHYSKSAYVNWLRMTKYMERIPWK